MYATHIYAHAPAARSIHSHQHTHAHTFSLSVSLALPLSLYLKHMRTHTHACRHTHTLSPQSKHSSVLVGVTVLPPPIRSARSTMHAHSNTHCRPENSGILIFLIFCMHAATPFADEKIPVFGGFSHKQRQRHLCMQPCTRCQAAGIRSPKHSSRLGRIGDPTGPRFFWEGRVHVRNIFAEYCGLSLEQTFLTANILTCADISPVCF